jgi:hypothetical protein
MAWDVETLKEYTDQRFEAQDRAVQAALQAAKEAVDKANIASEKRFESINEFRGQLSDQQATFLTRNEYGAQHDAMAQRLQDLADRFNTSSGRTTGLGASWGVIVSVASILIAFGTLLLLILKH